MDKSESIMFLIGAIYAASSLLFVIEKMSYNMTSSHSIAYSKFRFCLLTLPERDKPCNMPVIFLRLLYFDNINNFWLKKYKVK